MLKMKIAKIAGIAVGATVAFGAFVPMAGAVTVAELQAQVNALMAQLAALQGSSAVSTSAAVTSDLTVGSSGAQVSALQGALVAQGHLVMPAGVATGYFGSLTKSAVQKWQAANGVSATGYFGPLSRAKYNASAPAVTAPVSTVGISTPGVEGTIAVSVNPSPAAGTKLYEGEQKKQILGLKLEAKASDIKVERIKIDLDSVTNTGDNLTYTKIASKIYVMDGSTVLASADLNSTTVVKDGSDYFITLSGFGYVVPANSTKVLYIALDAKASWDSAYDNDSWSLGIPANGLRGIDGVGVNEYGPSTAFSREFTSAADLVDSATLAVSLNSASPETNQVICKSGTDTNDCDLLELMKVDFKAEKDNVTITDLVVDLVRTNNATPATTNVATTTVAYLYDGSTLIGSASVAGTSATVSGATFADIDYVIPRDTTKTLSVKVDVRTAQLASDTYAADIDTADVTAENSAGTAITESGTAQGKTLTIRKVGPQVTLVSKSIVGPATPQNNGVTTNVSTSTLTATFNIKIKAVGGVLSLGSAASSTPLFASSTASFKVYRNGSYDALISAGATSTSYYIPNGCVSNGTNTCDLADGAEVTVPVSFLIIGRTVGGVTLTTGSVYSVGLEGITWFNATTGSSQTTTFMAGLTDWRTADVSFP